MVCVSTHLPTYQISQRQQHHREPEPVLSKRHRERGGTKQTRQRNELGQTCRVEGVRGGGVI